ncbi:MAG TPA: hypothetical protein VG498_02180 [Terriglobales bacterium]|nr:hypothetical protein [Terriglobales bacterium]
MSKTLVKPLAVEASPDEHHWFQSIGKIVNDRKQEKSKRAAISSRLVFSLYTSYIGTARKAEWLSIARLLARLSLMFWIGFLIKEW